MKLVAADVILLDELLAQYGPETINARQTGRRNFELMIDRIWHEAGSPKPFEINREAQAFLQEVYSLAPQNDVQKLDELSKRSRIWRKRDWRCSFKAAAPFRRLFS